MSLPSAPLPTTPGEALAYLHARPPSTIRLGLERVTDVLAALGHPERAVPALHVAGTNGKGSTCAFASAALVAAGRRTGLYTSPHLERINERIQVDGAPISDAAFGTRILEVLAGGGPAAAELTHFELGTVAAFLHFARERVDVAVLEVGLGGRLDATNLCRPAACAISPVSFDHVELLGGTLAAIAGEKAGILKPGVPAALARQAPEAEAAIRAAAARVGAPLLVEGTDFRLVPEAPGAPDAAATYRFEGPGGRSLPGLRLGLRGAHQQQNAALALAALGLLPAPPGPDAVRAGLAAARWPGRLEEVGGVLLDGAHNPAGVQVLLAALEALYPGRRVHAVFGVVADKDRGPMLRGLLPRLTSVHLVPLPTPRSLAPGAYLTEARALCPQAHAHPSLEQGLVAARAAAAPGDVVLCTGSLFLVGAARHILSQGLAALRQTP